MRQFINTILEGDCEQELKNLPDNSIDSVVTDPPYGLKLMGKAWDYSVPSIGVWKEVLRVLKPGGHLLAFGGTRTYHRMVVNIEDAGFEIRDQLQWIYGSGFPKSLDISKALDKKNGRFYDDGFKDYCNTKRIEKGLSLNDINELLGTATNGGGVASALMGDKQKNELPTLEMYRKLKAILDLDDRYGSLIEMVEAERETIGTQRRTAGNPNVPIAACVSNKNDGWFNLTAPATDAAKQWQGWGTALKPANEPIVLARKPVIGTIAENVLRYGTGGLNIDECRIETEDKLGGGMVSMGRPKSSEGWDRPWMHDKEITDIKKAESAEKVAKAESLGRFPANVIHDGSDEVLNCFPETSDGGVKGKPSINNGMFGLTYGAMDARERDRGSAARFFYSAKASPSERGDKNTHPTVKPIELMQYLIKLITPPEGIVLDPYAGSGTTLIAARMLGYNYVGVELNPDYVKILRTRLQQKLGMFQ